MELADTPDLGSGAYACGFESHHPHQIIMGKNTMENLEYKEKSSWVRLGSYNIPNRNGRVMHITETLLQEFKDKLPKQINHGQNVFENNNFYDDPDPIGVINDISWELRDNGIMHVYGNISKYDNPVWDKFCGDHDFSLRAIGNIRKTEDVIHEDVSDIISWDIEDFDLIDKRFISN